MDSGLSYPSEEDGSDSFSALVRRFHGNGFSAALGLIHAVGRGGDGIGRYLVIDLNAAPAKQNGESANSAELEIPQPLGDRAQPALCFRTLWAGAEHHELVVAALAAEVAILQQARDEDAGGSNQVFAARRTAIVFINADRDCQSGERLLDLAQPREEGLVEHASGSRQMIPR